MTNYWKQMKIDASDAIKNELEKRKEAYEKAHDIRKFEIGLFWQRATYYWAFILAAFTAHFALIGMLFGNENSDFSMSELYKFPDFSLFALAVIAFFCYFFSLCWILMNKGSKFWQKNWEGHDEKHTFLEILNFYISTFSLDGKGDISLIYKKGGMSKQNFSKIRSRTDPDYRPRKETVLQLIIGLRLTLAQAESLLETADICLMRKIQ